jgi:membrane protein implicated in regulation of membrane protease activity
MQAAWIWFGLTALALIGEVTTGTFYLLVVAVGLAAAGLVALADLGIAIQIVVCIVAIAIAMVILRKTGVLKKRGSNPSTNANINMDIGQTVTIEAWTAQGTARVWYRGTHWEAELVPGAEPAQGKHIITETRGNTLVVTPLA